MQGNKKKQAESRDERGRLLPGHTANPNGRPKKRAELAPLANKAPDELMAIAADPETSKTLRAQIYQWAWEHIYGKAPQQVDVKAETKIVQELSMDEMEDVIRQASELG